jgi:hypothetical protein
LIGEEQRHVCWTFTLEVNNLQNAYMTTLFVSFGAKNLFSGKKFVQYKNGNPNFLLTNIFFPNLYKFFYNLYISMDSYLVLCPLDLVLSVKRP